MIIAYGIKNNNIDVTNICINNLRNGNYIIIPSTDGERAKYFTDPLYGILKSIFILDDENNVTEYDYTCTIYIDMTTNKVISIDNVPLNLISVDEKIRNIHNKLSIKYGSFNDELPEQKMSVRYLTGNETILEIGGNIGRNSLIISYILNNKNINKNNLVVLESDIDIYNQLKDNRDLNNMNFIIENSALSKRKLIQQGWNTIVSDTLIDGYKNVNIISYNDLQNKYNIIFDTLVLDCEGAFYYILYDMPEILSNIKLIIMENDYTDINHKIYIDKILKENNFYVDYVESGGWGPCYNNFYEVWKKL